MSAVMWSMFAFGFIVGLMIGIGLVAVMIGVQEQTPMEPTSKATGRA